jgi:uncharacterized membrane protein YccC
VNFPDWREWLYSVKAFVAAMLALYIALALSLPNPYWSLATVYIVSHPLSGATKSKAIYRALGTIIGAAASVALVPPLVSSPILLSAATALWTGTLLYLALLNRTPSGYIFMLSAYTMPLISLPTLMHPELIYDTALARTEEILLGIVCASVASTVLFPKRIGPVLGAQMGQLLEAAANWTAQLLTITSSQDRQKHMRHRLLADMVALDALVKQLSYDTSSSVQAQHAQQMRLRMTMLIPQATALSDPLYVLGQRNAELSAELRVLVTELIEWMRQGPKAPADAPARLREAITARTAALDGDSIDQVLASNALLRLGELIDLWQDCLSLRHAYDHTGTGTVPMLTYHARQSIDQVSHFDHGLLLFSSVSAAGAILVSSLIWIVLGWEPGAAAVVLIAIANCFFAAIDDPRPQLNAFLAWVTIGSAFALIYLFAILPLIHTYLGLAVVLAAPLLLAGAFTGRPQHTLTVLLFTSQAITDLGLRNAYAADFDNFANSSLSAILGMIFALVWVSLTRPFGTELIARRLARAGWRDLAMLGRSHRAVDQVDAASRMVDRTSQLLPRIALVKDESLAQLDAVRDLRIGLRLLDLQMLCERLPLPAAQAVGEVLAEVSLHFDQCIEAGYPLEPSTMLRQRLDDTVRTLLQQNDDTTRHATQALIGLRLALFPTTTSAGRPEPAAGVFADLPQPHLS